MPVSFNTIPSGLRVPLFYAEVDNSAAFTPVNTTTALLFGQKIESGTAQVNKPVQVSSAAMASELFGRGSMLYRMVKAYRDVDSLGTLVCIPLSDAGTAAQADITLTGTSLESGTIALYVGADKVAVSVPANTTAKDAATAVIEAISTKTDLPVIAAMGSTEPEEPADTKAVVTVQARNKGTVGNSILLAKNLNGLINGEKDVLGLSVEISSMTGGATDPELGDAIKAMGSDQYDFIACPYATADALDLFKSAMNDTSGRWGPYSMLYGHVYAVKRGDFNSLIEFGKTRNNQHETITALEKEFASWDCEALAAYVARTAVFIAADPARPTQTGVLTSIKGAPTGSRFDLQERNTLLQNGIATQTDVAGQIQIERAITTYQKNSYGEGDASYLDSETLHTTAYVMRRLKQAITSKYGRHKLANDGTNFGPGQAIVTPNIIKSELAVIYNQLEYEGIVENADLFKKYLIVERNTTDPNRVDVLFPPDYVNQLRIFALLNQFRLQYAEE